MKSLRYILGGGPHSLDDWVDLARKGGSVRVTLVLTSDELITDMFIRKYFVAEYCAGSASSPCRCREYYGGFFLSDPYPQREAELDSANDRLQRRLAKLRSAGVEVACADDQFDRTAVSA